MRHERNGWDMGGRLRRAAGRADLVPSGAPIGTCAIPELRAQEPIQPPRFQYEVPAVVDHGPLASLSWARFSGLSARLGRTADGA